MANHYFLGADVRCWVTFQDSAGTAQDPTAVNFKFMDASGNTTSYVYGGTGANTALVKSDTGIYYVDIDADEKGTFWYRWWSTGTGKAAAEASFRVEESRVD